jgi:hypothetical protein
MQSTVAQPAIKGAGFDSRSAQVRSPVICCMAPSIAPPKNLLASAPRPLVLLLAEDAELRIARIRGARGNDDNAYASTRCEPSNTIIVLILMLLFIMPWAERTRDFSETLAVNSAVLTVKRKASRGAVTVPPRSPHHSLKGRLRTPRSTQVLSTRSSPRLLNFARSLPALRVVPARRSWSAGGPAVRDGDRTCYPRRLGGIVEGNQPITGIDRRLLEGARDGV